MKLENPGGLGGGAIQRLDISEDTDGILREVLKRKGQHFSHFCLSPDGEQACFIHYAGNSQTYKQEVWLADIDPSGRQLSNPRQLTEDSYSDKDCQFSADGKYIYWRGCEKNGSPVLFRMKRDGSDKVKIAVAEADSYVGVFTLLGSSHVAYDAYGEMYIRNIRITKLNGERVKSLSDRARILSLPIDCGWN